MNKKTQGIGSLNWSVYFVCTGTTWYCSDACSNQEHFPSSSLWPHLSKSLSTTLVVKLELNPDLAAEPGLVQVSCVLAKVVDMPLLCETVGLIGWTWTTPDLVLRHHSVMVRGSGDTSSDTQATCMQSSWKDHVLLLGSILAFTVAEGLVGGRKVASVLGLNVFL